MDRRTFHRVAITGLASAGMLPFIPSGAAAQPGAPLTIPAIREWKAGGTPFRYGSGTRIAVATADAGKLTDAAKTFAADLAALLHTTAPEVVTGEGGPADLRLRLGETDQQLGPEGYLMRADGALTVSARTVTGAFRGTRTVLQLLRQSPEIPGGTARDWPRHPVRAFLTVPRTFRMEWWQNQIRELSYLKYSETHLYVDTPGLSKDDMRELDAFAARYHIAVVPQLNMPGHMHRVLPPHPEYQLRRTDGTLHPIALDLSNPAARSWAKGLLTDHIDLFHGGAWHLGGDEYPDWPGTMSEYPQLSWDMFYDFVNEADELVLSRGKSMRLWNDMVRDSPATTVPRDDITIEYWMSSFPSPVQPRSARWLADQGYRLVNANFDYLYDIGGWNADGTSKMRVNPRKIWEEFTPGTFHGTTLPDDHPAIRGVRFAQWNDPPLERQESDDANAYMSFAALRATAQVAWGSPKPYATWAETTDLVIRTGRAPAYRPVPQPHSGAGPGVARDAQERLVFFATRRDGTVEHGWQPAAGTGPWERAAIGGTLGGGAIGDPSVVLDLHGSLSYFVRTRGGTVEHGYQPSAGTGPWKKADELGAQIADDPAATQDASGRLMFFARRTDGRVLFGRQSSPGSGPWTYETLDRTVTGSVAPTSDGFFARTTDGRLLHARLTGSSWAYAYLTQAISGDPATARDLGGNLAVAARTPEGRLFVARASGSGWLEHTVGADTVGSPALALDTNGRLAWLARRPDGSLLHGWQSSPGSDDWRDDEVIGSGTTGDPSLCNDANGKLAFFARRENGRLLHGWQTEPGTGPWDFTEVGENIG